MATTDFHRPTQDEPDPSTPQQAEPKPAVGGKSVGQSLGVLESGMADMLRGISTPAPRFKAFEVERSKFSYYWGYGTYVLKGRTEDEAESKVQHAHETLLTRFSTFREWTGASPAPAEFDKESPFNESSRAQRELEAQRRDVEARRNRLSVPSAVGAKQTLTISVPANYPAAVGLTEEQFIAEAKLLIALQFFAGGKLSSGKAAELCGISRIDFLFAASEQGIPISDLSEDELADEFREIG